MMEQKTLKQYVKPGSAGMILGWIFLGLMVVCIIAGIIFGATGTDGRPTAFNPAKDDTGDYVYLDVVGISDWLYDYDGVIYYSAEDEDGYLYTVRMTKSTHKKMADQQEYWERESNDEPMPEPYRLYGMVQKTTSSVKEDLAEMWDMSTSEYDEYFGEMFLNATTTPKESNIAGFLTGALFCGIMAALFLLVSFGPGRTYKKCIRRLEELGELERAEEQLNSPGNLVIGKDRARLSSNYLFSRKTGVVVRYEDIMWCFKRIRRYNYVQVDTTLVVYTPFGKNMVGIQYGRKDKNNELDNAMVMIYQHNPNTLFGFTGENNRAYKEKMKATQL